MGIRRTIELHDSELLELKREGRNLAVVLDAYVHRENDALDIDAGRFTGWRQQLALVMRDAEVEGELPDHPVGLSDGELLIVKPGHERRFDALPLPFEFDPDAHELTLFLESDGGELLVRAKGLRVEEQGEARFIERNAFGV